MPSSASATVGVGADDDPIVLPDSPPIGRSTITFMLNDPIAPDQRASRTERLRQRRAMPPQVNTQPPATAVIDLTEEPDSPVEQRPPAILASSSSSSRTLPWPDGGFASNRHRRPDGSRHPRRTNSTRISPPMLTRSDSTLMGGRHSIIDLTQDAPEEPRPLHFPRISRQTSGGPPRFPFFSRHGLHHPNLNSSRPPNRNTTDEMVEVVTAYGAMGEIVQNSLRHYHDFVTGSFSGLARAFTQPQLDVTRNAFASRQDTPQPAMEPVPPARAGFTRDTHVENDKGDEEIIAVCPACDEELAYDPDDISAQKSSNTATTAAGKKRKRAAGEHHFWALKKCGHVYCADCFENRKPSKANPRGVGFLLPSNKTGNQAFQEMRCAVEGCETKVAHKGEWVGIFL